MALSDAKREYLMEKVQKGLVRELTKRESKGLNAGEAHKRIPARGGAKLREWKGTRRNHATSLVRISVKKNKTKQKQF